MTDHITLPRAEAERVLEDLASATDDGYDFWASITALKAALAEPVQEPVPRLITTEPWGWLNPPYGEVQRNLAVKATWASTATVNPPYPLYLGHPEASHARHV